jgi:hypothetical protein
MRNSRGLFWGGTLLTLGVLWLLQKMNLLNFDWYLLSRYWAALLVAAGVILIFSGRNYPSTRSSFAGLLVILAIVGAVINKTHTTTRFLKDSWDWDEYDLGDHRKEKQLFDFKMDNSIERGELNLSDGAGSFTIEERTDKLFEAYTNPKGFSFNVQTNQNDKKAIVDLNREEMGDLSDIGESEIKLNANPVWNVKMEIGAGKADFDFSKFKIEKLNINAAVGKLKLKLGDQYSSTSATIESGVSNVSVEVPKETGCEIRLAEGVSSHDFDDFDKVEDGLYRSPGYAGASKKIVLHINSGISKIRIKRY